MEHGKLEAIGSILLFIIVLIWVGVVIKNRVILNKEGVYSIGTTIGSHSTSKGVYVDYAFSFKGLNYTGSRQPESFNPIRSKGRYLVLVHPKDPTINRILWDQPVPDHITEAPPDGWSEIPK